MGEHITNEEWTVAALIETLEAFPKNAPIVGETDSGLHHLAAVLGPIDIHGGVSFVFGSRCPQGCPRCER